MSNLKATKGLTLRLRILEQVQELLGGQFGAAVSAVQK